MKRMILLLVLISIAAVSCNLFHNSSGNNPVVNTPVVTNLENVFTYTINAASFSDSLHDTLEFNVDETILTYSIIYYDQGSIELTIFDSDSTQIYQDLISNNKVMVEELNILPSFIKIILKNFDGIFELTLANDE